MTAAMTLSDTSAGMVIVIISNVSPSIPKTTLRNFPYDVSFFMILPVRIPDIIYNENILNKLVEIAGDVKKKLL